ncbi:MAG TPA: formyltransferase family protein [Candidatus Paceibacterota bacterium]|nr:formyltransferase family protein [Candidatus Paceibacterota bacterium]
MSKLIIFASGSKDGGGSGFENLVNATKTGELDAKIVAVVSNHEHGGVRARADKLGVSFEYFPGPFDAEHYRDIVKKYGAEWVALSGWLKLVAGLDPARTFNIHPAPLSFDNGRFGGPGLYGHHVHEAVKKAFDAGEITESGLSMHFVTGEYDRGPVFFEYRVPVKKGMTADDIAKAVNVEEHRWQPKVTNMVVHGEIYWDGKDPHSLRIGYQSEGKWL